MPTVKELKDKTARGFKVRVDPDLVDAEKALDELAEMASAWEWWAECLARGIRPTVGIGGSLATDERWCVLTVSGCEFKGDTLLHCIQQARAQEPEHGE